MIRTWAATFALLVAPACALAGRPLYTNDPYPLEHRKWQVEAGVGYAGGGSTHHFDAPLTLTYGLIENLEVAVSVGGQLERTRDEDGTHLYSDFSDTGVATKFILLNQEKAGLDIGGSLALTYPSARESRNLATGTLAGNAALLLGRRLTEDLAVLANLGWTCLDGHTDESMSDYLHYNLAITWQATKQLQPVAEIFALSPTRGHFATDVACNVGLRIFPMDNVMFDLAVGTRICGNGPDMTATAGVTLVF